MEFKTEPIRKKSGCGFVKIIVVSIFVCLLLHFLFSHRHDVANKFNEIFRPYLEYPSARVPTPKWVPKGDVLPLRKDPLSKRPSKAVVVVASGGVGNQLFMYAAGYSFARCLGVPLYVSPALPGNFDFGVFPEPHPNTLVREFLLHHFNVPGHQLVKYDQLQKYLEGKTEDGVAEEVKVNGQSRTVNVDIVRIDELNFHNTVEANYRSVGGSGRMVGRETEDPEERVVYVLKHNFQSHLFFDGFEEEVKEIFNLEGYINSRMALTNYYLYDLVKEVNDTASIAMHVRRGDFLLANSEYTPLPWHYFERAMISVKNGKLPQSQSQEHPKLHSFIFSDSLDIVKQEFKDRGLSQYGGVTFVSNGDGMTNLKELFLMQQCKDFVIPNSAFSWWAAFLSSNETKTVIAPYPRFTKEDYAASPRRRLLDDIFPIYPPKWTLINPWKNEA